MKDSQKKKKWKRWNFHLIETENIDIAQIYAIDRSLFTSSSRAKSAFEITEVAFHSLTHQFCFLFNFSIKKKEISTLFVAMDLFHESR